MLKRFLQVLKDNRGFARVTGPFMSLTASGSLKKTLVASNWKGKYYIRAYAIPANPRTAGQVNVRTALTLMLTYWHATAVGDKALWDAAAAGLGISGFNLYLKRGMDAYVTQLTTAVTPTSVSYAGSHPTEVWTWA